MKKQKKYDEDTEEFLAFLNTRKSTAVSKYQYLNLYIKYKNFLRKTQRSMDLCSLQDFINSSPSHNTRLHNKAMMKEILTFKKSPLIFDIEKIEVI